MNTPPMTPDEFRECLAMMTVSELETAQTQEPVKACLALGGEYESIWREAVEFHHSMEAIDIPAPRRNIAAGVLATIAREEQLRARPRATIVDNVRNALRSRVAVPFWAVAAALLILIGSVVLNFVRLHENPQGATSGPSTIVVQYPGDQKTPEVINAAGSPGHALSTGPSAGLIIILGAPPASHNLDSSDFIQTKTTNLENTI